MSDMKHETQKAEAAFYSLMEAIPGINLDRLEDWKAHARSLAEADAEALGADADACYRKLLKDFGSLFQEMEQRYEGSAAAIFNYEAGYTLSELLPAADWIHNGGTAAEAYAMAQDGAFELGTFVQRESKPLTQAELDAIYESHRRWLEQDPDGQCADFSGMELSGLELRHMDLSYANFSGASLNGCDMEQAHFEGCNFAGAHFYGVQAGSASLELSDFTGAHLEGSNFFHANFENSNFTGATFEHVNLHHANLDLCVFHGAEFRSTSLDRASAIMAKGLAIKRPISEAQAELEVIHAKHTLWQYRDRAGEQADFTGIGMTKMDFSGKDFAGALFKSAELERCDMSSGNFIGCDFSGATLNGCDFSGADCRDADFSGAELHSCNFTDAELDGVDFSQAFVHHCNSLEEEWSGPAMKMGGG